RRSDRSWPALDIAELVSESSYIGDVVPHTVEAMTLRTATLRLGHDFVPVRNVGRARGGSSYSINERPVVFVGSLGALASADTAAFRGRIVVALPPVDSV